MNMRGQIPALAQAIYGNHALRQQLLQIRPPPARQAYWRHLQLPAVQDLYEMADHKLCPTVTKARDDGRFSS